MGQLHYCHRCYHDCNCEAFHMLDCTGCAGCADKPTPASGDMLIDADPPFTQDRDLGDEDDKDGFGWGV